MIRGQAAGRHDAVDVRMADQGLSPGVENAQHADLRAEMSRIGGDLAERGGARLKEPGVQSGTIPIDQRQEPMREREDDVHIRHVEQLPFTGVQPALARLRLALRAVPIPTRVIGDGLMAARAAGVDVSAEGRGPAAHDGAEHRSLLHAQPRMLLDEGVALRVEDIGHLHRRPAHGAARLPLQPRPRDDHGRRPPAAAPADSARPADGAVTGADTPSCARGRRGPAAAGSCAGRRRPPAGAWRTNDAACAG